jgi:polar amino acid transport system substrate-binding protein
MLVNLASRPLLLFSRLFKRLFAVAALACLLNLIPSSIAQAAEWSEIQERGYLIVAVKDNLSPLGYRNLTGELVGLEIDLARQLAVELLGDPAAVEFVPVANQARLPSVIQGEVDFAIAQLTATGVRSRLVDFSVPYYLDGTAIVTADRTLQQVSDLRNQSIAVLNGSTTIAVVRSLLPSAQLVGVESYQAALNLLESQQVTAFAADVSVLTGLVQAYPDYRLLPALLSAEALCIAMPRGLQYEELRHRVNDAIERWYETGWLQERIRFWGLPQ